MLFIEHIFSMSYISIKFFICFVQCALCVDVVYFSCISLILSDFLLLTICMIAQFCIIHSSMLSNHADT